jgi:hypothetical protein
MNCLCQVPKSIESIMANPTGQKTTQIRPIRVVSATFAISMPNVASVLIELPQLKYVWVPVAVHSAAERNHKAIRTNEGVNSGDRSLNQLSQLRRTEKSGNLGK